MLTTLAVAGYRSLVDVVLPLHPLTVITGANGSGKSNLYRALRLLAATGHGRAVAEIAREGGLDRVLWAGPETPQGDGARGHDNDLAPFVLEGGNVLCQGVKPGLAQTAILADQQG